MNEQDSSIKLQDRSLSPESYSKKIAMLCATHGVPSGNTANLAAFMRALNDDKCLAMNFWSLIARMHDLEQGSNERLLEAIAEGVTGGSVVEVHAAGGEPRRLMKQMAAMLAGEDIDLSEVVRVPVAAVRESSRVAEAAALVSTTPAASVAAVSTGTKWHAVSVRQEEERSQLALERVASKPIIEPRALVDVKEEPVQANRVPLEGYGEQRANGSVSRIAFVVLMVVAAGAGVFVARGEGAVLQHKVGPSVRAGYDAAWRGVKGMGGWISGEVLGR